MTKLQIDVCYPLQGDVGFPGEAGDPGPKGKKVCETAEAPVVFGDRDGICCRFFFCRCRDGGGW